MGAISDSKSSISLSRRKGWALSIIVLNNSSSVERRNFPVFSDGCCMGFLNGLVSNLCSFYHFLHHLSLWIKGLFGNSPIIMNSPANNVVRDGRHSRFFAYHHQKPRCNPAGLYRFRDYG